jgi:glycosyltransferase involved in cell wall biosynthesis
MKAKNARIVVAETKFVKEDLINFWKIDEDKITQMITPTNFQENSKMYEAENYAVYPSAFWRHKNHKKLIDAIKLLKEDNVQFMFYLTGEIGIEGREVIKYVRKVDVEDLISFTDYMSRSQLEDLINKCKFVVIPSVYESLSLPGFEAIRANKPIVCSDIPQFRYQFGRNATFFDPSNSYDIYLKIKKAIEDEGIKNAAMVNSNLKEINSLNFGKASCYLYKKCLHIMPTDEEQSAWKKLSEIIYY